MLYFHQKPHISKLPVRDFPSYEHSDQDVAVIIPLFGSDYVSDDVLFDNDIFCDVHCHGAIWAALSLIYNTDIGKHGIPIYFYIEDIVFDLFMRTADKFNVPEHCIKQFHVKPAERHYDRPRFGKKIAFIADESLDFETVVHWDSDLFVCSNGEPVEVYDSLTSIIAKRQVIPNSMTYNVQKLQDLLLYIARATGLQRDGDDALGIIRECFDEIGLVYPNFNSDDKRSILYKPHIAADILCYPLRHYRKTEHALHQFLMSNYHNCYDDELLIALWCLSNDVLFPSLSNFVDYGRIWAQDGIIEHHNRARHQPYFVHIHLDSGEDDRTDEYFDKFFYDLSHNIPRGN